ncbi:MlaD family protein [bacterium]|nr:MlaD family protein [bacterium]
MATKAQKVRLSIFLIGSGAVLLVFFIALVGSRILKRMDPYTIVYEEISVTGLEPGAAVKYHGVQVGRVADLSVRNATSIQVSIQVEHLTPIKKDTEAVVSAVGITGLKFIELTGGTESSELLEVGGTIKAGQSLFDTISGQAEVILAKLEQVINNLNHLLGPETTVSLQNALNSVSLVSTKVDTLLTENRYSINRSVANLDSIMENLAETSQKTTELVTTVHSLVSSEDVTGTLSDIRSISAQVRTQIDSLRLAETTEELRKLLVSTNQMVVHYDLIGIRARDDILKSMSNLEQALDNLREATDVIRENPSVLLRGRQTTGDRIE